MLSEPNRAKNRKLMAEAIQISRSVVRLRGLRKARMGSSLRRIGGAEFGDDFGGGFAGFVFLVGGEGDGADAGVASSAIALADGGEVDHLFRRGFGPGVGADGDLGAEAGFGEADGVGRLGMQVVGDELVVALERLVGDVEVDGSLLRFRAGADEIDGALVAFEERGKKLATQGCSRTCWRGMRVSNGMRRGMKAGSWVDSMMRVSFMAGAGISTASCGLS